MNTNLVIVGELNPYGADPYFALYHLPRNASGNRLREILGLADHTYAALTKVNLCTGRWSMPAARAAADMLRAQYNLIVCLGAEVRGAFAGPAFFESTVLSHYLTPGKTTTLVTLPHPSGLNRMWDEPGARDRARALMASVLPGIRWGESR